MVIEGIDKLKEINELQELILSVLFHDLRGLLGTIDNISSILSTDYDKFPESEKKYLLKTISGTTNQLNNSVDSLLTWSYFRMGKLYLEKEQINFVELFEIILSQLFNYITQKEIKVEFSKRKNLTFIANERILSIGLLNIVHNAVKYSKNGSVINIDIKKNRKNILLTVSDNGAGIRIANMNKLFQIPCNFRTSGTNGESGFGLGLVIAKDFIEACGGSINIESGWKKGTIVEIILPVL